MPVRSASRSSAEVKAHGFFEQAIDVCIGVADRENADGEPLFFRSRQSGEVEFFGGAFEDDRHTRERVWLLRTRRFHRFTPELSSPQRHHTPCSRQIEDSEAISAICIAGKHISIGQVFAKKRTSNAHAWRHTLSCDSCASVHLI